MSSGCVHGRLSRFLPGPGSNAKPLAHESVKNSRKPLPCGRGFHERASPCQGSAALFLPMTPTTRARPTGGSKILPVTVSFKGRFWFWPTEHEFSWPTSGRRTLLLSRNFLNRRFALLPFALSVELVTPVPFGVLNLRTGAAISVSSWTPQGGIRSATTSQSPEPGDFPRFRLPYAAALAGLPLRSGS